MEHTPGPWRYHVGRGAHPRLHIQTTAGYQIASTPEISRHTPEAADQKANARLIAAAPELLEACKRVLLAIKWDVPSGRLSDQEQADILRAAIAKATGE